MSMDAAMSIGSHWVMTGADMMTVGPATKGTLQVEFWVPAHTRTFSNKQRHRSCNRHSPSAFAMKVSATPTMCTRFDRYCYCMLLLLLQKTASAAAALRR